MKKLILFASAAIFAVASPVAAKPDHAKGGHVNMKHGNGAQKASRGVVTNDRYGRMYALNARGSCPPGLAKKNNGCLPPGQAKKSYNVGQRYNRNFGNAWTYNQIPDSLRSQYNLDQSDRYYYNNGYLYQVNPRTSVVEQVISALLR
jgi:hypothetical protein